MSGRTQRSRITAHPPRLSVRSRIVLGILRRDTRLAWPVSELVIASGLRESSAWWVVQNLLELGLIEKRSSDAMIRVVLTSRGRRYHL